MKVFLGWSLIALGVVFILVAFQVVGKEFEYSRVGLAYILQNSALLSSLGAKAIGALLPSALMIYYGRSLVIGNKGESRTKQLGSLALAAADGDLETVKVQLQSGTDVNGAAPDGSTSLMYAARNGHIEIAKLLLEFGANPQLKTMKGDSAFDIALRFRKHEIADLLRTMTKS